MDAALANLKGQETSIKGVLGKLQAAKNTLKQHVENHNKLHAQLQDMYKKREAQAAIVDELQESTKRYLNKRALSKPQTRPLPLSLVECLKTSMRNSASNGTRYYCRRTGVQKT